MLYHPMTNKFYDVEKITYTDIPEGTVVINRETYKTLLSTKGFGQVIGPDENGQPVLKSITPPVIDNNLVNEERSKRIAEGAVVEITGYGPVALQGRPVDQINLIGLYNGAVLRIQQGDTTTTTKFRDRDNVDHDLTPTQIVDMWVKGTEFVSSVIQASWELKDMDPIPLDYTDDKHWP